MQKETNMRMPQWNEKRVLRCKKCGKSFLGKKLLFFTKCPHCGSRSVEEDGQVRY